MYVGAAYLESASRKITLQKYKKDLLYIIFQRKKVTFALKSDSYGILFFLSTKTQKIQLCA